jgi:protein-S-isoprenylcysteine O-methyltransferase Ste14
MRDSTDPTVPIPLWQPIFTVLFLGSFSASFIWASGDWKWTEGWLFVGLFVIASLATSLRMYLRDPALFRERFGSPVQEKQKPWDKFVIFLIFISYLAWYYIMPLDVRRFGWSPAFPVWLKFVGFLIAAFGFWLFYEAFRENTFAAPVVKIQEERKQTVVSTGLYGFVRHPLYASAGFMAIGTPLLVGSVYGLIAGSILILVLAVRSVGEEAMLKQELAGYSEYTERVRWRMLPFVF